MTNLHHMRRARADEADEAGRREEMHGDQHDGRTYWMTRLWCSTCGSLFSTDGRHLFCPCGRQDYPEDR